LLVYNKIDIAGFEARVDLDDQQQAWRVWLSAITGSGFDGLIEALRDRFCEKSAAYNLVLQSSEGQIRAFLFESGAIESENFENNGDIHLKLRLTPALFKGLQRRYEISSDRFEILDDALAGAA
jgi:GTP-binding protein HflX